MHQTRAEVSKKIPIERKGTKYVVRTLGSLKNSVPVLIALRNMLALARNKREVKDMINRKLIKINGKEVKDYREPIYLFNILEAGKHYTLTLTENSRFKFDETKHANQRLCRVIGKKLLTKKNIQLNLHDGTNILSNEKINVGDSVYLDMSKKITKHLPLEKGKECFIISGRYTGLRGKIESLENNLVELKLPNSDSVAIDKSHLFVI